MRGCEAHQLVAAQALGALAAADPGIDDAPVADGHILGLGADRQNLADDLVAHGEGQLDAAVGDVDALAAAEVEEALPDVEVAVAHAAGRDPHQHLGPLRDRVRIVPPLERPAPRDDLVASHPRPPLPMRPAAQGSPCVAGGLGPLPRARPRGYIRRRCRSIAGPGARRMRHAPLRPGGSAPSPRAGHAGRAPLAGDAGSPGGRHARGRGGEPRRHAPRRHPRPRRPQFSTIPWFWSSRTTTRARWG